MLESNQFGPKRRGDGERTSDEGQLRAADDGVGLEGGVHGVTMSW